MHGAHVTSLVVLLACGGNETRPAPPANTAPTDCPAQTAELRTFLGAVLDPAQTVAAPWPTGDTAFDADLSRMRDAARAKAAPQDPGARQKPMSEGVTPGRLEQELASCRTATAQLEQVGEVSPEQRIPTYVGLADAIAACGCTPNIPRVKALVYLGLRGPD